MIIVIFIITLLFCSTISASIAGGLWYNADQTQKNWECIPRSGSDVVIGRVNKKGDSECMYIPETGGCFVMTSNSKNDLEKKCKNIIKNYPSPMIENQTLLLDTYTCGKNSTFEKLWNGTGYEDKDYDCYKIRQEKSLLNENQKFLRQTFGKII